MHTDYAMPKETLDVPPTPPDCAVPLRRLVYGHLGCNVIHEDIVFDADADVSTAKYAFKHAVEDKGGKLPAEHGHGTECVATRVLHVLRLV